MKISTQGQSRFLTHDEVRTPLVATMDRVTEDRTLRNPYVLHFTDTRLKPLPLNVTNRRILVAAYGDDDAAWHGQLVELYFNPSIPNPRNPALPGGICVRIPTGPGNGTAGSGGNRSATPPSPKPAPQPPAAPKPATPPRPAASAANGTAPMPKALAAEWAQALEGLRRADSKTNADRWKLWVDSLRFDDESRVELSRAHAAALDRIAAASARRPVPSRT